jgi:hypothetical protein
MRLKCGSFLLEFLPLVAYAPPDRRTAGLFGKIQVESGDLAKAAHRLKPGIVHIRHIVVLRLVYGLQIWYGISGWSR